MIIERVARFTQRIFVHALLLGGAAITLLPFVWMIVTSLKPPTEIYDPGFNLIPNEMAAIENYSAVFADTEMVRYLLNGLLVCAAIIALQLLFAVPAAYALAKLPFRGRSLLFSVVLVSLLVPIQVPALPLYVVIAKAGLLDSYASLILPFMASAFGIFLFRQFFMAFPDQVIEAARLDGFGELEIAWKIVLPAAAPAVGAFVVFTAIVHWNDLYWPMIVISTQDHATPPIGLVFFKNQQAGSGYGELMAAATVISAPLVFLFLFAQRSFVRGFSIQSRS